jgi:hypothetical protein
VPEQEPNAATMDEIQEWCTARLEQMDKLKQARGSLFTHEHDLMALYQLVAKLADRIKSLEIGKGPRIPGRAPVIPT